MKRRISCRLKESAGRIIIQYLLITLTVPILTHILASFDWYFSINTCLLALGFDFALMDDNFPLFSSSSSCGSSSSVPQSEGSVNQPPNPDSPEPVAPDVYHPLLDDNTRSQELNERGGLHWQGISDSDKGKILEEQIQIEKGIERALLSDGYSRASLNTRLKRDTIRGFFFYPEGTLMTLKTRKKDDSLFLCSFSLSWRSNPLALSTHISHVVRRSNQRFSSQSNREIFF